jgi:hypothetical protein
MKKLICFSHEELKTYNDRVYEFWRDNWSTDEDRKKYDNYVNDIKSSLLLKDEDMDFKRRKNYRNVVLLFDKQTIENIFKNYNNKFTQFDQKYLFNLCQNVDKIGKPMKENTFLGITEPVNIKYIFHAIEILNRAKMLNLNNIDFIEIGGGYGGLAYFLKNIAESEYFNIKINSYTMFDLPEAGKLQERVSKFFNLDLSIADINSDYKIEDNNFLISNYAFSEIRESHKKLYMEKIFPTCSHGFLTWNVNAFNINYFDNVNAKVIEIPYIEKFGNCDLRVIF